MVQFPKRFWGSLRFQGSFLESPEGTCMEQKNTMTMKELPNEVRPYERCLKNGPECLNDAELLAVILRTGCVGESCTALAARILHKSGGLAGLFHVSAAELLKMRGIGKVKMVQIQCIAELSRRMAASMREKKVNMREPASVAEYYMEDMRHRNQEVLKLIMLDTKSRLIRDRDISKGTVNASLISPREIFMEALRNGAVFIILMHNHPSGDPSPSPEDIRVTSRVAQAGMMLGISLVDHIIIGEKSYVSLKEQGML